MYMKAVGNRPVLRPKISSRTFSQAGRAPTVLFTERKFQGPTPVRSRPTAILARVPMLSMVKYSCTVQLFRTAVLCHVINMSVTSSDTSSQERVDKTTRKI